MEPHLGGKTVGAHTKGSEFPGLRVCSPCSQDLPPEAGPLGKYKHVSRFTKNRSRASRLWLLCCGMGLLFSDVLLGSFGPFSWEVLLSHLV